MPYSINPQLFSFELGTEFQQLLAEILDFPHGEQKKFSRYESIVLYSLITRLLSRIPPQEWLAPPTDSRIRQAILKIESDTNSFSFIDIPLVLLSRFLP
ncbi:MAG: hypothetical protein PHV59_05995 [Victivallales bacterium]|nr:hypothetical protein [Victivallales bacterium]